MLQRLFTGLIASGFTVLLFKFMGVQPVSLERVQPLAWQEMPLFTLPTGPDPATEAIVRRSLQDWSALGSTAQQGVWLQSELTTLAEHQGTVPLPAASLTKIVTTLAALEQWEPAHQFETLIGATGPIQNGVLQGDLVVTGSGDPLFVWEEAIALGNSLNQLGIRRVSGNLVINGNFAMNFQDNPTAGQLLKQALNASSWSPEIETQYRNLPPKTPKPQVAIAGDVKVATSPPQNVLLLRHQSLSLTQLLKEMNVYSNNAMAEMLANSLGGAQAIASMAAAAANVPPGEIQLINGSGLGVANRISPRATCAMLIAIDRTLQTHQLSVTDLFPVAGREQRGTMRRRQIPAGTAVKTGTLADVSALAGVLPTRDRGLVWFAIINRGTYLTTFQGQQDQFLARLALLWGTPATINLQTTQAPPLLGDPKRIEKVSETQARL